MDRWAQVSKKPSNPTGGRGRRLPGEMISGPAFNFLGRQLPSTPGNRWSLCDSVCMRTRGRLLQKKHQPQIPRLAPLILLHLPIGFSFFRSFFFSAVSVTSPLCCDTDNCPEERGSMCWDYFVKGNLAFECVVTPRKVL